MLLEYMRNSIMRVMASAVCSLAVLGGVNYVVCSESSSETTEQRQTQYVHELNGGRMMWLIEMGREGEVKQEWKSVNEENYSVLRKYGIVGKNGECNVKGMLLSVEEIMYCERNVFDDLTSEGNGMEVLERVGVVQEQIRQLVCGRYKMDGEEWKMMVEEIEKTRSCVVGNTKDFNGIVKIGMEVKQGEEEVREAIESVKVKEKIKGQRIGGYGKMVTMVCESMKGACEKFENVEETEKRVREKYEEQKNEKQKEYEDLIRDVEEENNDKVTYAEKKCERAMRRVKSEEEKTKLKEKCDKKIKEIEEKIRREKEKIEEEMKSAMEKIDEDEKVEMEKIASNGEKIMNVKTEIEWVEDMCGKGIDENVEKTWRVLMGMGVGDDDNVCVGMQRNSRQMKKMNEMIKADGKKMGVSNVVERVLRRVSGLGMLKEMMEELGIECEGCKVVGDVIDNIIGGRCKNITEMCEKSVTKRKDKESGEIREYRGIKYRDGERIKMLGKLQGYQEDIQSKIGEIEKCRRGIEEMKVRGLKFCLSEGKICNVSDKAKDVEEINSGTKLLGEKLNEIVEEMKEGRSGFVKGEGDMEEIVQGIVTNCGISECLGWLQVEKFVNESLTVLRNDEKRNFGNGWSVDIEFVCGRINEGVNAEKPESKPVPNMLDEEIIDIYADGEMSEVPYKSKSKGNKQIDDVRKKERRTTITKGTHRNKSKKEDNVAKDKKEKKVPQTNAESESGSVAVEKQNEKLLQEDQERRAREMDWERKRQEIEGKMEELYLKMLSVGYTDETACIEPVQNSTMWRISIKREGQIKSTTIDGMEMLRANVNVFGKQIIRALEEK